MEFMLDKKAKKSGGDKYVCKTDESFIVYFPQAISRKDGQVLERLWFDVVKEL